jgi:hypothetical protein
MLSGMLAESRAMAFTPDEPKLWILSGHDEPQPALSWPMLGPSMGTDFSFAVPLQGPTLSRLLLLAAMMSPSLEFSGPKLGPIIELMNGASFGHT